MNLHVFNDSHGFVLNITVERFAKANRLKNNVFINLNNKTLYKNDKVLYLRKHLYSFKKAAFQFSQARTVTFYPLDESGAWFLAELRKLQPFIEVRWVFWSYEFYHRPERRFLLLESFSKEYCKRSEGIANKMYRTIALIAKKIARYPFYNSNLLNSAYRQVNTFFSFLPEDYKNVFREVENPSCIYKPISFLSTDQMINDVKPLKLGLKIIVGHAATPTANHAEVFRQLSKIEIENPILLPLEYGENKYKKELKKLATKYFSARVAFLEKRMRLSHYYQQLSDVGFAIFNFRWQEALGNILFLLWNGAKVFLRRESSVYCQLSAWGLTVFSVSDDVNRFELTHLLPFEEASNNKKIIEELFSEKKVKEYWEALM